MKSGAWIHERDLPLDGQIRVARQSRLHSILSYSLDYTRLAADWCSQVRLDELAEVYNLGVEADNT
jgi:hypothetical protein